MFPSDDGRQELAQGLLERAEARRQQASRELETKAGRADLGQFFTPQPVAKFIAQLLDVPSSGSFRLLDPGAGIGSLSAAVVAELIEKGSRASLTITAFELDGALEPLLAETLADCKRVAARSGITVASEIRTEDFIAWAATAVGDGIPREELFGACVMNPPYRKVRTTGPEREALERVGLSVTNLYAAFVALASRLLVHSGQLAAITPRSFANGVYFKSFREFLLDEMCLDRLHVYEDRDHVFADAQVLQENVVFRATRGPAGREVVLSSSTRRSDVPQIRRVPYGHVIRDDDPNMFIRIPVDEDATTVAEYISSLPVGLKDLDLEVSTGRVVDFRARDFLRMTPEAGTVPLIYPSHLRKGRVVWPQPGSKKPNSLVASTETKSLLLPRGTYVLVKRFTAKEEKRRVVATVVTAEDLPGEWFAFENHLNVFHRDGSGLPNDLANGLAAFLNSAIVDRYVRQFSGHTQINATDLRHLRYPSSDDLASLGSSLVGEPAIDDYERIDDLASRTARVMSAVRGAA